MNGEGETPAVTTSEDAAEPVQASDAGGSGERSPGEPDVGVDDADGDDDAGPDAEPEDELTRLQRESAEYLDGWRRATAELDNFRKRNERERAHWNERVLRDVLGGVLDTLDLFDRALEAARASQDQDALLEGVEMIRGELERLVESKGAERVATENAPFDPRFHEALMLDQRDDVPDNTVVAELRRGYRLGEFVIRPAQVQVARGGPKAPAPAAGEAASGEVSS